MSDPVDAQNSAPYTYDFSFAGGPGPWTSWMSPTVIHNDAGIYADYTRLQAPGQLDPNHLDGIGPLWLVSHLSSPVVGALGPLDLRDADIELTIRGHDFDPNGAKLCFWVCSYLPDGSLSEGYTLGLQVTNWANTANDLAGQITDDWQTLTVHLANDEADWTYAGNNVSSQGDWANRYVPYGLSDTLANVDATLHLVLIGQSPDQTPSGFLDIADIKITTQTQPASAEQPAFIGYGIEDQVLAGQLNVPADAGADATFSLVAGSVLNGTVTLDESTGAFTFTPDADFYGPTDFVGAAEFKYTVTSSAGTTNAQRAYFFFAPENDAPAALAASEDQLVGNDRPFEHVLRKGTDIDGDSLTFHIVDGSVVGGTVSIDATSGRYIFTPDQGFIGAAGFQYTVTDGLETSAPKAVTLTLANPADVPPLATIDVLSGYLQQGRGDDFVNGMIRLAEAGDVNAAYHYGTWLANGLYVTQDARLAATYLERATATVPDAKIQLAALYSAGNGVPHDYEVARALLETLPNDPIATYKLATLIDAGLGGPVDRPLAVQLFLDSAKAGNGDAAYTLGRRYLLGEGVAASADDAYFWIGVGLDRGGGPAIPQFKDLLRSEMAQAARSLSPERVATLDDAVLHWHPGDATPVNDAPVVNLAEEHFEGLSGQDLAGQLLTGTDLDGDALSFVLQSASGGTIKLNGETGAFVFTNSPGFSGDASFSYALSDGQALSATKTVSVHITPVTAAFPDAATVLEQTEVVRAAAEGVLANDASVDGALTVTAVMDNPQFVGSKVQGTYGSLILNSDGSYRYVADQAATLLEGQVGVDLFSYKIADASGHVSTSDLTITVNGLDGTVLTGSGTLIGTAFGDRLTGGTSRDVLIGLDGNDVLSGGTGDANELYGGRGDDVFIVAGAGDTIVENPGEGVDVVQTALGVFRLGVSIENLIYTGSDNFTGIGNELDNMLQGGAERDVLVGLDGNDTLIGGNGVPNQLQGGTGNDIYVVSAVGDTIIELSGQGVDTVNTTLPSFRLPANVENLVYVGSSDFVGTGNDLDNGITGGAGNDRLIGGAGNNTLIGGDGIDTADYSAAASAVKVNLLSGTADNGQGGADALFGVENLVGSSVGSTLIGNNQTNVLQGSTGPDTLVGLDGEDVLDGGSGAANEMLGGAGDDSYYVSAIGDSVIESVGQGRETVFTALTRFVLPSNVERLVHTGSTDFTGIGNELDNEIHGGGGKDVLIGRAGADVLSGGAGADIFVYERLGDSTPNGADTLMDFQLGVDRIDLRAVDAITGTSVLDAFSFVAAASFSGKAGELRYSIQDGMTIVQADVNGNGQADFELHLAGAFQLTPDAFILA